VIACDDRFIKRTALDEPRFATADLSAKFTRELPRSKASADAGWCTAVYFAIRGGPSRSPASG